MPFSIHTQSLTPFRYMNLNARQIPMQIISCNSSLTNRGASGKNVFADTGCDVATWVTTPHGIHVCNAMCVILWFGN